MLGKDCVLERSLGVQPRTALIFFLLSFLISKEVSSRKSYFTMLNAGTTGMYRHAQLRPEFLRTCQLGL